MGQLNITYKIFLEAEDISQPRIHSSTAFVKNRLEGCRSVYFKHAAVDDESSLDEFTMRLYIENEIHEETCTHEEDAESFVLDMAEFLDAVASAHSFLDMEGSFSWEYKGRKETYRIRSESGCDYCDFTKEQQG